MIHTYHYTFDRISIVRHRSFSSTHISLNFFGENFIFSDTPKNEKAKYEKFSLSLEAEYINNEPRYSHTDARHYVSDEIS